MTMPDNIIPTAERIFATIAPMIRAGKQPGSVAAIAGASGVPSEIASASLRWMEEQGWIIRWRPEGKGAYQYSLPAEEYTPDDSPDVSEALTGEALRVADDFDSASHLLEHLAALNHVRPKDLNAAAMHGRIMLAYDERRLYNTVQSERQGHASPATYQDSLNFVGRLYRIKTKRGDLEDHAAERERRIPSTCSLCRDVYFPRDDAQLECYACENGVMLAAPLPGTGECPKCGDPLLPKYAELFTLCPCCRGTSRYGPCPH